MKKIPAFTLSELLVVLVISSIVVTLSFLALSNVQKQLKNVTQVFEKQQQIETLERWLYSDLNLYKASYDVKRKSLIMTSFGDTIQYEFGVKTTKRATDSLSIIPDKIAFYLDGKEVNSGVFDAIEMFFSEVYAQRSIFVYKRKDASYYVNQ